MIVFVLTAAAYFVLVLRRRSGTRSGRLSGRGSQTPEEHMLQDSQPAGGEARSPAGEGSHLTARYS